MEMANGRNNALSMTEQKDAVARCSRDPRVECAAI
jgi:hypothetical protein